MFDDNIDTIYARFFQRRNRQLWDRFPGVFRSVVVETNDPLRMHRVRFKCPDIHDWNLKPEHCPWAVVDSHGGGKRTGSWHHPMIGDWVWIKYERNHVYGPVVSGFCDPTRRKFYTYPSIFGVTPLPVDENGDPASSPDDYDADYHPKDERPMSQGIQDRYGNLDMSSSVGYFPIEHKEPPPDPDYDAIQQSEFKQKQKPPEINDPDVKYMLRMSKYGHIFQQADQGYYWKKDGDLGEFEGDFDKDEEFEIKRWKYLLKLHNEDEPKETDQRRIMSWTRYGHKFEMRDVGWAQMGPCPSKSREGEYGEPRTLSKEEEKDYRWIKLRTKGGHLFQMYDKGFHPDEDEFVKRKLIEEVAEKTEKEDEFWKDKDGRWIRLVSRYGYKIVIDDRGTDTKDAEGKELPRGNGILFKGRRTGGCQSDEAEGDEKGFYWEFNENEDTNQTTWGSPLGNTVQINDRHQYMMASMRRSDYPRPWKKLEENEFLLESLVSNQHEDESHHWKLDHHNEYIRFKTRASHGESPCSPPVNPPGVSSSAVQQGLEARDGSKGDGPWCELVDAGERNLWFWNKGYVICHARRRPSASNLMWWLDENKSDIVIRHNESSGKLQLFCNRPIEIISRDTINLHAKGQVTVRSDEKVVLTAQGTSLEVGQSGILMNKTILAPRIEAFICGVFPGPGAGCPKNPSISPLNAPIECPEPQLVPTDRGKRYNTNLDTPADKDEIEHPMSGCG